MSEHTSSATGEPSPLSERNHYLELAKLLSAGLHNRQGYEWKMTLGFWAALVAISWQESAFDAGRVSTGYWAVAWLLFVFVWVRGVWTLNANDEHRIERLFQHATGARTGRYVDCPRLAASDWRFWFGFLGDWSALFQSLATAGIIAAIAKGERDTIARPRSLETFWWGDGFVVTWFVVAAAGIGVCCLWRWLASCRQTPIEHPEGR